LLRLIEALCVGDTLVVWRPDRLSRSLKHLIERVEHLIFLQQAHKPLKVAYYGRAASHTI
jgi:hypothetical protein